jgi:hypothetical protein
MKAIAYKTILDNIADGVFRVDSELKITFFRKVKALQIELPDRDGRNSRA